MWLVIFWFLVSPEVQMTDSAHATWEQCVERASYVRAEHAPNGVSEVGTTCYFLENPPNDNGG